MNCGNEFVKDFDCDPHRCRVCHEYDSFEIDMEEVMIIEQLCPICNSYFETSHFLNEAIEGEHTRWLANMVTHYRHNHITSWNNMWGRNGNYYRNRWCDNISYDELKIDFNERAKRQILRKCKSYLIENKFTTDHVKQLEHSDIKTIHLYEKILCKSG